MVEDIGFLLVEGTHRYCSATNARKNELAYALDAFNFVTPVKICGGDKKIANMAVGGHLRPIETRMVHSLEEKQPTKSVEELDKRRENLRRKIREIAKELEGIK